MKKLMWISTGGTISCVSSENGLSPAASAQQIMEMQSVIDTDLDIHSRCIMNIDSTDITCEDIKKIGFTANDAIIDGYDGIIITHGTDTMAYTSAVLSHMLSGCPVPVIITGSQRPFFAKNTDAATNLKNAFTAASNSQFKGVYIVFGDKIIAGDKAYKAYTINDNAFISPSGEYAAIIENGKFTKINTSVLSGEYKFCSDFTDKVEVIKLTPCTRSDIFEETVKSGIKRIVIEGYGMGGIPKRLLSGVKMAADSGVKMILISQCLFDGVFLDVYEVGINAEKCGIISGGKMTADAAVAMLMFSV